MIKNDARCTMATLAIIGILLPLLITTTSTTVTSLDGNNTINVTTEEKHFATDNLIIPFFIGSMAQLFCIVTIPSKKK